MTCEERRAALFRLKKRKQRRDLIAACSYLMGGYKEDRARFFLNIHSLRTRDSGYKQQYGKIQLEVRKFFCAMKVAEYQNRLLSQFVVSPSLEIFKT